MSANRRFFAIEEENSIFVFTIDTNKIVNGATNGSENPLTFIIPFQTSSQSNNYSCILRVSDGREDVQCNSQATFISNKKITFSAAGIYKISIIGSCGFGFQPFDSTDRLKIIEVNRWGQRIEFLNAFYLCSNLVIKATNPIQLNGTNSRHLFNGIKGFESPQAISAVLVDKIVDTTAMFSNVQNNIKNSPNVFWNEATFFSQTFFNCKIDTTLLKFEVIAPKLTEVFSMFWNNGVTNADFRLIIKSPNLQSITKLWYGNNVNISFGEVDIRSLTFCSELFRTGYPTSKMDETLTGWVNNFNWTGVAPVSNKVTIDCYGAKYSNNSAVIAAKAFLESKGYVFTRLTMA